MEAEGTVVARAVDMVVDRSDRNLIRFFFIKTSSLGRIWRWWRRRLWRLLSGRRRKEKYCKDMNLTLLKLAINIMIMINF